MERVADRFLRYVKIDTKSPHTKEKVYYYKTNKEFKRGDKIDIKVESGGTPTATVVIGNSKKNFFQRRTF